MKHSASSERGENIHKHVNKLRWSQLVLHSVFSATCFRLQSWIRENIGNGWENSSVEYVSSIGRPKLYETCTYLCQIFLKLELFQYRYKIGIYVKSAFKKCCVSLVIYSENTENKPAMTGRWNYCLSRHFFVLDSAQPTDVIGRYKNFFSCTAWFEYLFQFNTPSFPYSGRERERHTKNELPTRVVLLW